MPDPVEPTALGASPGTAAFAVLVAVTAEAFAVVMELAVPVPDPVAGLVTSWIAGVLAVLDAVAAMAETETLLLIEAVAGEAAPLLVAEVELTTICDVAGAPLPVPVVDVALAMTVVVAVALFAAPVAVAGEVTTTTAVEG